MPFLIADTFTDALTRLPAADQKRAKTTAFDLQVDPTAHGLRLHRVDRAKDPNFWTARVDGKPTPTFRANLGFTALEIDAGAHRVELAYSAPGLMIGWVFAGIALGILLIWGCIAKAVLRKTQK